MPHQTQASPRRRKRKGSDPATATQPPKINFPIPLTKATRPEPPTPIFPVRSAPTLSERAEATRTGAAQPPPPVLPTGTCPVCDKGGLPPGRLRHVRCEGASRAGQPGRAEELHVDANREEYRRLVSSVERREASTRGRRTSGSARPVRIAAARTAVILRCEGRCENPACLGQPQDVTDSGEPLLQVDHVDEIASGGRDHPSLMVALCPNCHAIKTLGRTREQLRAVLAQVSANAHATWSGEGPPQ
ncbi:HNH endonuclease signature motif containing protein [Kitasatospora sp. NPDC005856]|uniref:HNH endonuclease signature motif containing protein n=1 Tax=Kitasatospora sp. NPDC005856 TaxID=3154566 RepID=UPI0033FCC04E